MITRRATLEDLDGISMVESTCFPVNEAASKEEFAKRLNSYPNHFLLGIDDGKLISFVDGFVTDERDLTDEMYENASLHSEKGAWQMIFGVNTIPEYRNRGIATALLKEFISMARKEGRKGVVLTCKEQLIPFYSAVGFVNEGKSKSVHGGEVWYQMRITF